MEPVLGANRTLIIAVLVHVAICVAAAIIPMRRKSTATVAGLLAIAFIPAQQRDLDPTREVEAGYRSAGCALTRDEWSAEPGSATAWDGLARLTSARE